MSFCWQFSLCLYSLAQSMAAVRVAAVRVAKKVRIGQIDLFLKSVCVSHTEIWTGANSLCPALKLIWLITLTTPPISEQKLSEWSELRGANRKGPEWRVDMAAIGHQIWVYREFNSFMTPTSVKKHDLSVMLEPLTTPSFPRMHFFCFSNKSECFKFTFNQTFIILDFV